MIRRLAVLAAAAALAAGGCGDDDESSAERTETKPTDTATTERTPPERTDTDATGTQTTGGTPASPEEQPGGAGDEGGANSPAMFTGRGGRIRPQVVRVPPFLAIRVELRSADGRAYALRFGGKSVVTGGGIGSASTTLEGLRPKQSISGVPAGGGNRVRIEATAEPGP